MHIQAGHVKIMIQTLVLKESIMKRKSYVAGYFYPSETQELKDMVSDFIDSDAEKKDAVAVISPHAGLIYSGQVAGSVFSSVHIPDTVVLIGPSHGYMTSKATVMLQGSWETPFGDIAVDNQLANDITTRVPWIKEDSEAHDREHSLEVQLPFLKFLNPGFAMVPILISYYADYPDLENLGKAIAAGIKNFGQKVLIVASTDMSHQVDQETAKKKDFLAIDEILELRPKNLYDVVRENNISMCGFQSSSTTLVAAKELGAGQAELVRYQTSGEVTGDYNDVVGYAGIRIF